MSENKEIKTNKREPPEGASEGTIRGGGVLEEIVKEGIRGNHQIRHKKEPSDGA